jgi:hypothetical protein
MQESLEGLRDSKLKKVNNGGQDLQERLGIHWGRRGIYRWGKMSRWKQIPPQFGGKSGPAGLFAGRSGGQSGGRQKAIQ